MARGYRISEADAGFFRNTAQVRKPSTETVRRSAEDASDSLCDNWSVFNRLRVGQ